MTLSADSFRKDEHLQVCVDIKNTGNYEGEEVVQLYIRDLVASVTRPVKELKAFQKIRLKPGESQQVVFDITEGDLKFYNATLDYVAELGEFSVFIGTNSRDVQEKLFSLVEWFLIRLGL